MISMGVRWRGIIILILLLLPFALSVGPEEARQQDLITVVVEENVKTREYIDSFGTQTYELFKQEKARMLSDLETQNRYFKITLFAVNFLGILGALTTHDVLQRRRDRRARSLHESLKTQYDTAKRAQERHGQANAAANLSYDEIVVRQPKAWIHFSGWRLYLIISFAVILFLAAIVYWLWSHYGLTVIYGWFGW